LRNKPGTVYLVGAGPGDPGLLTLRAAEVLRLCDVLLYDALASDAIVAFASCDCEKTFVGKRGGKHAMPQADIEALMVRIAREGKSIVRLKGGDPFVFGRGAEEAQTLAEAGIPFEIVPGISSSVAAPAYAGISVTHRDHNPAYTVATGHEDPTKPGSTLDWAKLADPHRTLVLLMAMGNLETIARNLVDHGLPASTPVAAIQNGTRPDQRTVVGTLATIAAICAREGIAAPAIVVVGDVVRLREEIRWYDVAPLFGKRVLVTRPERQAADLAARLRARGAEPIVVPAIEVAPLLDGAIAEELASHAWIALTSANAVDALFGSLAQAGRDARAIGSCKIGTIGPATAAAVRARGLVPDLSCERATSEDFAHALLAAGRDGDRILLYQARDARDALRDGLAAAGRSVTVRDAYETRTRRSPALADAARAADVLTFASPSAVRGFVENGADAGGKVVACIGPVAARAADAAGIRVDVTAEDYTAAGLVAALEEFFASARS